jgi:hypothetical protein
MIIQQNTASNDTHESIARYFIAQHIPDVMRRETRNVGVFVHKGDEVSCRFFGEDPASGKIDGRQLKSFRSPKAYRQWVKHWRRTVTLGKDELEDRLTSRGGINYLVIPGGEVTATGTDSAREICSYLYSLLVSEGGLREALGGVDEPEDSTAGMKKEITSELRRRGLMSSSPGFGIRNPVYTSYSLKGGNTWYEIAYFQETQHESWAIEPINFMLRGTHELWHAHYAAVAFDDICANAKSRGGNVHTVALIQARPLDLESDHVRGAYKKLLSTSDVVDWTCEGERQKFYAERERIGTML